MFKLFEQFIDFNNLIYTAVEYCHSLTIGTVESPGV